MVSKSEFRKISFIDFTPEQCNEISTLLSSGDVLSAEVPQALARLARQLEASGLYPEFRAQNPKDGMLWLKKNIPHIYLDVCVFLEHHGHRAIMEVSNIYFFNLMILL